MQKKRRGWAVFGAIVVVLSIVAGAIFSFAPELEALWIALKIRDPSVGVYVVSEKEIAEKIAECERANPTPHATIKLAPLVDKHFSFRGTLEASKDGAYFSSPDLTHVIVWEGSKPLIPSGSPVELTGTLRFQLGSVNTLEADGSYFYVYPEEAKIKILKK